MCGLVTIISKNKSGFFFKDKTIFLQMLISDMFRGMDSTGAFAVNKHGNLKMIKDASAAPFFINKKDANDFFNNFISDYHIVVGHNRKATMGVIQSENAHPFIEGNICLVHNGTLQNHYKLADRVVDSNAVAAHINEQGYKSLLKNIEGAYALIWYNAEEKMLYFTRNAERPLYMVEITDKIYLASENKMLDWILDRNDIGKYTIQNVPTDKVFKFNLDTRKLEAESKPKKESTPNQKHKYQSTSGVSHQQLGFGHLALVHSSGRVDTPSIETYSSGEKVSWRLLDWEENGKSYKLVGETTDSCRTPVNTFLDMNVWKSPAVDAILDAEFLTGVITSISSKRGEVQLWIKDVSIEEKWHTLNHKLVTPSQIEMAGGCCYSCGTLIKTKDDTKGAVMNQNSKGDITYITCEFCNEAMPTYYGG